MAFSKARRLGDLITANAEQFITSAHITDTAITGSDIHSTFDLTGKTVTVATASAGDNDTSAASTAFVQQEIASLVDSAPGTLNTLNELAAALGDDANFSTTVTNSIATKLPLAGGTMTGALNMGSQNITAANRITLADGVIDTGQAGSSTVFNDSGSTADFRIESDSNTHMFFLDGGLNRIGVNTSGPNGVLHIGSSNATGDSSNPAIQIGGTSTYRLGLYTDSEGAIIQNLNGDDGIQFRVKTAGEAMRINGGDGNVGIGTESPAKRLHIRDDTQTNQSIRFGNETAAPYGEINYNSSGYEHLYIDSHGTTNGYGFTKMRNGPDLHESITINSDGYVTISRNANEYGLELRSTGTRSGLVLATPNSGNTIKGSLLLLTDDTLRLGTQSVYNIHMDQSGYNTMPNQVYARMYDTGDQTINGWTKIEFDSPSGTSSSSWSTTNNRFTIPKSGRYLVDTRIRYATGVTYNYTGIYINGSPYNYNSGSQTSWGNDTTIGGAQIIDLNVNDYIELWAYSPTSVVMSGGSTRRYMNVWLLG